MSQRRRAHLKTTGPATQLEMPKVGDAPDIYTLLELGIFEINASACFDVDGALLISDFRAEVKRPLDAEPAGVIGIFGDVLIAPDDLRWKSVYEKSKLWKK